MAGEVTDLTDVTDLTHATDARMAMPDPLGEAATDQREGSAAPPRESAPEMAPRRSESSWLADNRRRRRLAAALIATELVLLTLVVALVRRDSIEADLAKSVTDAISIEHPGLDVSVAGRDVTIRGGDFDAATKAEIVSLASKRRGVRTVKFAGALTGSTAIAGTTSADGSVIGAVTVPTAAKLPVRPPQVTAVFDATSITVSAEVPSVEAKTALLGRVKEMANGPTLRDQVTVAPTPKETADLAQYRRLGTFLDTMARLPVRTADLNFDRTTITLNAQVADDARRELLVRESVVLVGGQADRVRGEITLTSATDSTTVTVPTSGDATTSTAAGQTTTSVGSGSVTVPPLPSTPEAQAAQTAIATAIDGRTIGFQKSSSALNDAGKAVVVDAAAAMKSTAARVEVGGHTDWKGRSELNQALSQKRADAVRQALIDAGVDATRITARGYGEDVPIASNQTESGRTKNRRIELRVIG